MKRIKLSIEIKIDGGWYPFSPKDCITLNYPCPKYPSVVFTELSWDYAILGNNFFITSITGEKNPHNIIERVDQSHIISVDSIPNDCTITVKERLQVSLETEETVYGITCFKGTVFMDTEYWDQELYNGSMKLRYRDLVTDFDKWVQLVQGLLADFDDHRFILWVEK